MTTDSDLERARRASRFFSRPDRYLARNTNMRVRGQLIEPVVRRLDPARILDLGAGDGSISLRFRNRASITLVDRSPEMIERALTALGSETGRVEYHVCDIETFEPGTLYDLVLCLGVIAHAASPESIIAKVARCVSAGGHAIVQVTDTDRVIGRALRLYATFRDRLPGKAGYRTTSTTVDELLTIGAWFDLQCLDVIRYLPAPPGSRFLPVRWIEQAQLFLAHRRRMGVWGTEALVVFSKSAKP